MPPTMNTRQPVGVFNFQSRKLVLNAFSLAASQQGKKKQTKNPKVIKIRGSYIFGLLLSHLVRGYAFLTIFLVSPTGNTNDFTGLVSFSGHHCGRMVP